jgi:hypothetical protein
VFTANRRAQRFTPSADSVPPAKRVSTGAPASSNNDGSDTTICRVQRTGDLVSRRSRSQSQCSRSRVRLCASIALRRGGSCGRSIGGNRRRREGFGSRPTDISRGTARVLR